MSATIECEEPFESANPSDVPAATAASASDSGHATKKHMRGSSLLLVGRGLATLINFAVQVLVVRYLSVAEFGAFAFSVATVAMLAKFAELGLGKGLGRYTAMYHEQRDYSRMFGSLILGLFTVIGVGTAMALGVYAFQGVLGERLVSGPVTMNVLLILVLVTPLQALEDVLEKTFAVFSRARALFFRRHLVGPLLKLLAVLSLAVFPNNVYVLATAYLVASAIGVTISLVLLMRILRQQDLISHFHWQEIRIPTREVFGFSIPLISSDVAFLFRVSLVVFLLEIFFGSAAVAAFRAVFPVARMNMLVFDSFKTLFLPWASRLFARGDRAGLSELYWRNATWLAVLSFPIVLATIPFCSTTTTLLFGDRYAASAPILAILSIGCFMQVVFGFGALTLRVVGHVRPLVVIDAATAVAALGLALLLIPRFGAVGGAISASSTLILQNVLYQLVLSKDKTVRIVDEGFARIMSMIVLSTAVLFLFQVAVQPNVFVVALTIAIAAITVVGLNLRQLQVAATFPELCRLPIAKHLMGASRPKGVS